MESAIFSYQGVIRPMDYIEQEKLTRAGDTSPEAIHHRLVATRKMTGMTSKQLAARAGIKLPGESRISFCEAHDLLPQSLHGRLQFHSRR